MNLLIQLFLFTLFMPSTPDHSPPIANNTVYGNVVMPQAKKAKRGNTYNKDGTPVMNSEDPMAQADRNVIVSLMPLDGKPSISPTQKAYITQKEQTFLPMVMPVTIGSEVTFINEDQFDHSIQSLNRNMKPVMRKPPGEYHSRLMKKAGIVKLGCDIHGHMRGYIWCLNTPYFARVDETGNYRIEGLPDGQYRIEVFHPDLTRTLIIKKPVHVRGGQSIQENLNLARP